MFGYRFVYITGLLILGLFFGGCRADSLPEDQATDQKNTKPVWITSIPPLASVLQALAGDQASVESLLPPGTSPHTYSPRPSDLRKLQAADVVVYIDKHFDGWMMGQGKKNTIALLELVPLEMQLEMGHHDHGHDHSDHHSDECASMSVDPHFWLDPKTIESMLTPLADALAKHFPSLQGGIAQRTEQYRSELQDLDQRLQVMLAPRRGARLICYHPSFQYFFRRYGLVQVDVIEPWAGKEPSPKHLKQLLETAREGQADVLVREPQLSPRALAMLENESGLPIIELDPLGGGEGRSTYEALLLFNANQIAQGY